LDTSADFPIWAECNEVAKVIPDIEKGLVHLKSLQQRSMDDPDTKPNTAINNELYLLSCKVMLLCRQSVMRLKEVALSPASAGFKSMMAENSRNLLRSVENFREAEEGFAVKLRSQMVSSYRSAIPEASEADANAVLDNAQDRMGFTTVRYSLSVAI
jgi:hypothetical protein